MLRIIFDSISVNVFGQFSNELPGLAVFIFCRYFSKDVASDTQVSTRRLAFKSVSNYSNLTRFAKLLRVCACQLDRDFQGEF